MTDDKPEQVKLGETFGFDAPVESAPKISSDKSWEDFTMKMLWALTGPIIVWPGYEDQTMPDKLKSAITMKRILLCVGQNDMATDEEAMWYLSTASFIAPMDRDWQDIYLWLGRGWQLKNCQDPAELPEFLNDARSLNEMEERDLKELKRWLYKKSMDEVKRKCKETEKAGSRQASLSSTSVVSSATEEQSGNEKPAPTAKDLEQPSGPPDA
jgi:hypothetical protein